LDGKAMLAGTKSSDGAPTCTGMRFEEDEIGRFSSKDVGALSVEKSVSPGACGGSSSDAGMRWSAPNPRTQPRAPSPPQLRVGVMVTGRVTLYSWLYTYSLSGLFRNWGHETLVKTSDEERK
jgi:hypothetical protein